jgi:hypothetical protein
MAYAKADQLRALHNALTLNPPKYLLPKEDFSLTDTIARDFITTGF